MDLDYLIDEVMHNITPLDWDTVINSKLPLKVRLLNTVDRQVDSASAAVYRSLVDKRQEIAQICVRN